MKFLIIQTAFIGDVVLATALVEKLRIQFPNAQIDFMLRKDNDGLLKNHPYIHKLYVWDKKQGKYKHLWQIARMVRKERYDYIINPHRFAASGFVTWFSGASNKIGFDKNPFSFTYKRSLPHAVATDDTSPIHEIARNQQLIADITDDKPAMPAMYPSAEDYNIVAPYQSVQYICMAPSSVWFSKRMPIDKWVALADKLPHSYRIYLIAGPEDKILCDDIIRQSANPNMENLAGKLSFLQSAALMQKAVMNYSNDSAPIHFASAVNAPVTAIFCSTSPRYGFGPLSDVNKVVEVEGLDCKPCSLHGLAVCPKGHFKCGKDLDVDTLLWWNLKQI